MAETKSELVEELSSQSTKAELVELLGKRLKKDEISKLLDDESDGTKEELLRKLGSRTKDELVQAVESRLTKDEIEQAVDAARDESDEDDDEEQEDKEERAQPESRGETQNQQPRTEHVDDTELDWSAELEWAAPPQPTPAPVSFVGAPPYMPGARVRVDLSGLPTMGIFLGKGASAAGTITGVNAHERFVRVYLDACFDGKKEIFLPPERVMLDQ
jgi:hypothetical protein